MAEEANTILAIDDNTRENWITQILADYPKLDRNMAESCLDYYLQDPNTFKDRIDEAKKTESLYKPKENAEDYIIKDAVSVA